MFGCRYERDRCSSGKCVDVQGVGCMIMGLKMAYEGLCGWMVVGDSSDIGAIV